MSQETWEILCGMKTDDVELQLALQCAPLITGLKISNLLTISSDGFCLVEKIISGSFISMYPLFGNGRKNSHTAVSKGTAGEISANDAGTEAADRGRVSFLSAGRYSAGLVRKV